MDRRNFKLKPWAALITTAIFLTVGASARSEEPKSRQRPAGIEENYGKLPLGFEANQGHSEPAVRFLARGHGYSVFLTPAESVFLLRAPPADTGGRSGAGADLRRQIVGFDRAPDSMAPPTYKYAVLRVSLVGASSSPEISGVDQLPGRSNYFTGRDPAKWRTGIPTFARVKYRGVYEGVDLLYHGNEQGRLEYDFELAPRADPRQIALRFKGARALRVDKDGNLVVKLPGGDVVEHAPVIYQESAGVRHPVRGGYELRGRGAVGFSLAAYDRSRPVTIDPVLIYSTYLGGSGNDGSFSEVHIAVDDSGSAYVAGFAGVGFPTTGGAYQTTRGSSFISKFSSDGTSLIYSTYFPADEILAIAIDSSGNAYVTGDLITPNFLFPTSPGAFQTDCVSPLCAFVTALNNSGSALIYSTYLGGVGTTLGEAITVDGSGDAFVTGRAGSGFPTTPGAFQTTYAGGPSVNGWDAFVSKLNPTGTGLVYSTYLGGNCFESGYGIAVDASGNAYAAGAASGGPGCNGPAKNFPTTPGAYQTTCPDASTRNLSNGFVTKFNSTGSALLYSTCLGGGSNNQATAIALDSSGNAYITGIADAGYPTTPKAFQPNPGSCNTPGYCTDGFVTKLNKKGSAVLYSTYLGGNGDDFSNAIALDSSGNVYLAGDTESTDFPTTPNALQKSLCGTEDAFVTQLNAKGSALLYSSYLGGAGEESAASIVLDSKANVYVSGTTNSGDFPTTAAAFQPSLGGGTDAFVTKFAAFLGAINFGPRQVAFGMRLVGTVSGTRIVTLTNPRKTIGSLVIGSVGSSDATQFVVDNAATTCIGAVVAPGKNCKVGVKFSPQAKGLQKATLTITNNAANSPNAINLRGTGR